MTANSLLANGFSTGRKLVHMMVDDLTPEEWLRQPVAGANCAAWIVGHLTLTLRAGLLRKRVANLPDFPAGLKERVTTTKQIAGEQSGFGEPRVLLALFDSYVDAMIAWIGGLSQESLIAEPDHRGPFGATFAEALQFGTMHIALHAGQLSSIRRSLGKPPIL